MGLDLEQAASCRPSLLFWAAARRHLVMTQFGLNSILSFKDNVFRRLSYSSRSVRLEWWQTPNSKRRRCWLPSRKPPQDMLSRTPEKKNCFGVAGPVVPGFRRHAAEPTAQRFLVLAISLGRELGDLNSCGSLGLRVQCGFWLCFASCCRRLRDRDDGRGSLGTPPISSVSEFERIVHPQGCMFPDKSLKSRNYRVYPKPWKQTYP